MSADAHEVLARLCGRRREILRGLLGGRSEKEIAGDLSLSPHSVHTHVKAIYRDFGVGSRAELSATLLEPSERGPRSRPRPAAAVPPGDPAKTPVARRRREPPDGDQAAARLNEGSLDVLDGLLSGRSEKQIAADLGISPHTVHSRAKGIFRKFGVSSRAELFALLLRMPDELQEPAVAIKSIDAPRVTVSIAARTFRRDEEANTLSDGG